MVNLDDDFWIFATNDEYSMYLQFCELAGLSEVPNPEAEKWKAVATETAHNFWKLTEHNKIMREALEWYAVRYNNGVQTTDGYILGADKGERARKALEDIK